jgi:nucleoside-diphosphate-sugar epimerase
MKILFTGASSFTGFWFVNLLSAAGHEIVCPLTKDLPDYPETRSRRLKQLEPICHFIPHAPFGSDQFLHAVQISTPIGHCTTIPATCKRFW